MSKSKVISYGSDGSKSVKAGDYIPKAQLAEIAERIRVRLRRTITDIIETGRDLAEAKSQMEHGQFSDWLFDEFSMTARTAQNYMRAAAWAEGKSEIISHLSPTSVYALAAPSTPSAVTDRVIADVQAGKRVNDECVQRHIKVAREDWRRARLTQAQPSKPTSAPVEKMDAGEVDPTTAEKIAKQPAKALEDLRKRKSKTTSARRQKKEAPDNKEKKIPSRDGIAPEKARDTYLAWLKKQPKETRKDAVYQLAADLGLEKGDFFRAIKLLPGKARPI